MLQAGDRAPSFSLMGQDGAVHTEAEFAGTRWVLYFYSKDNTPGCTREACAFRTEAGEFAHWGVPVVGVSRDSAAVHQRFAEKYELPFLLLSDPERQLIEAYGVWQEKKLYGKVSMGVVRSTFVIGADGTIEKVFPKAKPDTNAAEILTWLAEQEKEQTDN